MVKSQQNHILIKYTQKITEKIAKPVYPYWLLQLPCLKTNWSRTTDDQNNATIIFI